MKVAREHWGGKGNTDRNSRVAPAVHEHAVSWQQQTATRLGLHTCAANLHLVNGLIIIVKSSRWGVNPSAVALAALPSLAWASVFTMSMRYGLMDSD